MSDYPDWMLRAGYGEALFARLDPDGSGGYAPTGEAVRTASVRIGELGHTPATRIVGDGRPDVRGRSVSQTVEVLSWPAIRRLRRWREAGARVAVWLLARGRGKHAVWPGPNPIVLAGGPDGDGALGGVRLELAADRLGGAGSAGAVHDTPDLALVPFGPAGWTVEAQGGTGGGTWGTDDDGEPVLTLTADVNTRTVAWVDVDVPAPGLPVSGSVEVLSRQVDSDGAGSVEVRLQAYGPPGSPTAPPAGYDFNESGFTADALSSVGVAEADAPLPDGTHTVRLGLLRLNVVGGSTNAAELKEPALLTRLRSGRPIR